MELNKLNIFFLIGNIITFQIWGMDETLNNPPSQLLNVTNYLKYVVRPHFEQGLLQEVNPNDNRGISMAGVFGNGQISGIKNVHDFFEALIYKPCPQDDDFARFKSNSSQQTYTPDSANTISQTRVKENFVKSFFQQTPGHIIFLLGMYHCKETRDENNKLMYDLPKLTKNFIENFIEITNNKIYLDLNFDNLIKDENVKLYFKILAPTYETATGEEALDYTSIKNNLQEINRIKRLVEVEEERWEKNKSIAIKIGILSIILSGLGLYYWQGLKSFFKGKKK